MTVKLFAVNNWLFAHRSQIQIALILVVVSVALVSLLATGSVTLADAIPGGGH